MTILAANITSWSQWARDWVHCPKWDVALLAEVHFHPSKLADLIKDLLPRYVPTFSTPRISDDSPSHTYGGALVLRRNHLQGSPLYEDEPYPRHGAVDRTLLYSGRNHQAWETTCYNLAGQQLELQGGAIMIFASDHWGGIDWDVLGTLASLTRAGTHPFHPVW